MSEKRKDREVSILLEKRENERKKEIRQYLPGRKLGKNVQII